MAGQMCWRDRTLVRKLVQIRLNVLNVKWKEAKANLGRVVREMTSNSSRERAREVWEEVQEVSRGVWKAEQPAHQRKVDHLQAKSRDCRKHHKCRELDRLAEDRMSAWLSQTRTRTSTGCDVRTQESGGTLHPSRLISNSRTTDGCDVRKQESGGTLHPPQARLNPKDK